MAGFLRAALRFGWSAALNSQQNLFYPVDDAMLCQSGNPKNGRGLRLKHPKTGVSLERKDTPLPMSHCDEIGESTLRILGSRTGIPIPAILIWCLEKLTKSPTPARPLGCIPPTCGFPLVVAFDFTKQGRVVTPREHPISSTPAASVWCQAPV